MRNVLKSQGNRYGFGFVLSQFEGFHSREETRKYLAVQEYFAAWSGPTQIASVRFRDFEVNAQVIWIDYATMVMYDYWESSNLRKLLKALLHCNWEESVLKMEFIGLDAKERIKNLRTEKSLGYVIVSLVSIILFWNLLYIDGEFDLLKINILIGLLGVVFPSEHWI